MTFLLINARLVRLRMMTNKVLSSRKSHHLGTRVFIRNAPGIGGGNSSKLAADISKAATTVGQKASTQAPALAATKLVQNVNPTTNNNPNFTVIHKIAMGNYKASNYSEAAKQLLAPLQPKPEKSENLFRKLTLQEQRIAYPVKTSENPNGIPRLSYSQVKNNTLEKIRILTEDYQNKGIFPRIKFDPFVLDLKSNQPYTDILRATGFYLGKVITTTGELSEHLVCGIPIREDPLTKKKTVFGIVYTSHDRQIENGIIRYNIRVSDQRVVTSEPGPNIQSCSVPSMLTSTIFTRICSPLINRQAGENGQDLVVVAYNKDNKISINYKSDPRKLHNYVGLKINQENSQVVSNKNNVHAELKTKVPKHPVHNSSNPVNQLKKIIEE